MGRFNGIKYSGALKTNSRDFKRLKVRRSIDLMELEDRGTIAEGKSDLPTRGAAHRRHRDGGRRGARGATVNTVDLGYVSGIGSNVVDNQDFGLISETALTYNQTINQQRFGSLDEVTTDSVNTPVWNPNANTTTFVVTVGPKTGGGNAFYLDSGSGPVEAPAITLYYGQNYIFDVSDSSNNGHPFAFTIDDGVSEYKRGIARIGSPGQDKAKVRITIPNGNAISGMTNFKYYCTVHGTGMGNTINLTQFVPTYTITPAANNVDEGSTLGFTVNTDDNISVLYWNVVGYTPPVFSTPDMNGGSGSFAIHQNGTGFFNTGTILEDRTTEGAETFSIEFRTGSSTGPVVATSDLITINDTSDDSDNAGSYSWSISTSIDASNPPTNAVPLASGQPSYVVNTDVTNSNYHGQLHEGSTMTWSATTDAPDGVQVYFLVASIYQDYANPNTDDPSYPDITATPGTYGWLTASNGQVSGSITAIEDLIAESGEMKQIWLMASPTDYSNVLAESQWFHINDNPEPTYSLSADNTTINEGDTVTFTLTTTNVTDGTNIAYTVTGIDANDLSSGSLTGNITVNSNTGTAAFTLAADTTTEGDETMTLTLDNGGGALDVVITDSSTTPEVTSADFSNTTLLYTLDNPNPYGTASNDYFGRRVAISGDRAIVGTPSEDDASGGGSGKAYIYDVTTGNLVYTLDNPNAYDTSQGDSFGESVAISGDRAIVGAYGEDDAGGLQSGKAYIFDVTTGNLVYTLDNPNAYDTSVLDYFGYQVNISDTHAIVGAYLEDDAGGLSSGKAYIFDLSDGSLVYTLDNPSAYGTGYDDKFGRAVAISGNYAIVGAYQEDDASGTNSGKAYIFDLSDGSLVYTLDNPNAYGTSTDDDFGASVSISDTHAIVGALSEADAGGTKSGKAYIYDLSDGSLLYTLDNPNAYDTSDGDYFGVSVDLSDTNAIVGAWRENDAGGDESGKAYIFDLSDGSLAYTLDNPNPDGTSQGDRFGWGVGISGNHAIVGAAYEYDPLPNSGKAYIFQGVANGGGTLYSSADLLVHYDFTDSATTSGYITGSSVTDQQGNHNAVINTYNSATPTYEDGGLRTNSGTIIAGDWSMGTYPNHTAIIVTKYIGSHRAVMGAYDPPASDPSGQGKGFSIGKDDIFGRFDNGATYRNAEFTDLTAVGDNELFVLGYVVDGDNNTIYSWRNGEKSANTITLNSAITAPVFNTYEYGGVFAGGASGFSTAAQYMTDSVIYKTFFFSRALTDQEMTEFMNSLSTEFNPSTPSSSTWGGDRGFSIGGRDTPEVRQSTIEYWDIATTGNTSDFGDLTVAKYDASAVSNGTTGLVMGGDPDGASTSVIEAFACATTGSASSFGDLTLPTRLGACVGDGTYGIYGGGLREPYAVDIRSTIDYVTIATPGNATDFGDLLNDKYNHTSTCDTTRGVFIAGSSSSGSMEYITMATASNATAFGTLLTSNPGNQNKTNGIISNNTRGCAAGGTYIAEIEYITIQTLADSSDFGNLTTARGYFGGCSNPDTGRGIAIGGLNNPTVYTTLDYFDIATTGAATVFGDLITGVSRNTGMSGNAS